MQQTGSNMSEECRLAVKGLSLKIQVYFILFPGLWSAERTQGRQHEGNGSTSAPICQEVKRSCGNQNLQSEPASWPRSLQEVLSPVNAENTNPGSDHRFTNKNETWKMQHHKAKVQPWTENIEIWVESVPVSDLNYSLSCTPKIKNCKLI